MAASNSRLQQQQQQQQPNFGLPPPPRMIPDPSTLTSPYHVMQPPLNNNNANPQNHQLPELQLPGIARRNLPQNDGACDELTTEVKKKRWTALLFICVYKQEELYYYRKLINILKI